MPDKKFWFGKKFLQAHDTRNFREVHAGVCNDLASQLRTVFVQFTGAYDMLFMPKGFGFRFLFLAWQTAPCNEISPLDVLVSSRLAVVVILFESVLIAGNVWYEGVRVWQVWMGGLAGTNGYEAKTAGLFKRATP